MPESLNTTFCRHYYNQVIRDVRKHFPKEVIKKAWWYISKPCQYAEFHIPKCDLLPEGYYWYGKADNSWQCKAEGWQAAMEQAGVETEDYDEQADA